MHHDELRELAASYALDALSDEERRTFEQHVDVCPECAAEVTSLRATVAELAYAAPPRQAPAHLRARVLQAIEGVPASVPYASRAEASDRVRPGSNPWWLAAAATLAAILVGGYALTLRAHVNFLDQELREARAQSASAQLQLRAAQAQLAVAQREVQRVNLTTDDPRVSGRHPHRSERAGHRCGRHRPGILESIARSPLYRQLPACAALVEGLPALDSPGSRNAAKRRAPQPRCRRAGPDDWRSRNIRRSEGLCGHRRTCRRLGHTDDAHPAGGHTVDPPATLAVPGKQIGPVVGIVGRCPTALAPPSSIRRKSAATSFPTIRLSRSGPRTPSSADARPALAAPASAGRAARAVPPHPVLPEAVPFLLFPRLHEQERARRRRVSGPPRARVGVVSRDAGDRRPPA